MRQLRRHGPLHLLTLVAVAIGLFMIGYYWGNQYKQTQQPELAAVMLRPPVAPPLEGLVDHEGRVFDIQRLRGHLSIMALGDSADEGGRALLGRLVRIRNRLVDSPQLRNTLQIVFIDIALAADESAQPQSWVAAYGAGFVAVSGPTDALSRLATILGLPPGKGSDALFLADREGRIVALFPHRQEVDSIAADLKAYAESH
ncbi:MAG TPA: hypothetical protein EYH03_03330 [Chromatiales bacterium]|nr:hypothetical protein [Chromatiales bacterium]